MSTTTTTKKPSPTHGLSKRGVRWVLFFLWAFLTGPILGILVMLLVAFSGELPSIEELENTQTLQASEVYTADGELIGKYYRENRSNVTYNELSPFLVDCLVATEDERFYEHTGVDFEAIGRVVKGVVTGNSGQGGGSTITQQLAKLLFRDAKLSKTGLVKQKFKEWIIATRLERTFTKEEIITHYLNKVDFVNNAIGIKSAARVYFNTTPDSLRLEQAALIVGMLQNPSMYNPRTHSEKAKKRREVVLKQLLKAQGKNKRIKTKFTEAEYHRTRKMDLGLDFQKVDHAEGIAPYFREELRKQLTRLFKEQDEDGNYVYHKKDGSPYD
ncbi:MAG: transglycosylase domain-containing protein, partial [Flavobacteriales bacterium]